MNYERELYRVMVQSQIKYRFITIHRNGDIYYWGKHYGTLDEIKKKIDEAWIALGHNIIQPKK